MNKTNFELIAEKRKQLGLTQEAVAKKVAALANETFSQESYRKVEIGKTKKSRFLPYVCKVLSIPLSSVDPNLNDDIGAEIAELISRINERPQNERLEIVQEILASMNPPE